MADGVDIISDTTGQQIVSALEGLTNTGNTEWVYFSGEELYENASSGMTKNNVSIGLFSYGATTGENGEFEYSNVGDLLVPSGDGKTNNYFVEVGNTNRTNSATSGIKISAPGKILMIKAALRNSATSSRMAILVNNGGIVTHTTKLDGKAVSIFTCDFTKNIYASSTCYLRALETGDMQLYAIAVCYES